MSYQVQNLSQHTGFTMFHTQQHSSVSTKHYPRGFTLVELLVVIVIISILSSMVLMALANTQATAREARTRSTIVKLDALITAKWETYQTRRVPLKLTSTEKTDPDRKNHAIWRLYAIRDIMRMEMPDGHNDYQTGPKAPKLPTATMSLPLAYQRRALNSKSHPNYVGSESAECLYLISAYGCNDPDALSQFNESEIADTDGDGMNEFVDGWGRPISFLRWAPQYVYEINNPSANPLSSDSTNFLAPSTLIVRDSLNHHDPFDPMKVDVPPTSMPLSRGYAIYPLIYSAGPDKSYDLEVSTNRNPIYDPYSAGIGKPKIDAPSLYDSAGKEENWHDNITNHELLAN